MRASHVHKDKTDSTLNIGAVYTRENRDFKMLGRRLKRDIAQF